MATKPVASWLLAVLLAISSLLPTAAEKAVEKPESKQAPVICRCLALGMDAFVSEKNTAPCSANNAEMMAALFRDSLPGDTRITLRVNGPGTADELEFLIRDVFSGAKENDVSYLYFSTHGIIWDEEEGEKRTALILSDGDREEALEHLLAVRPDLGGAGLEKDRALQGNVVAVVDLGPQVVGR